MSFKEPQGQVARWLERLQEYDYTIEHRPGRQHGNADALSRRPRRHHGECPSCVPSARPQVATVAGLPTVHKQCEGRDIWSTAAVAQAQRGDPDIGPVVAQLSQEWKKPTTEELKPMSRTTRAVWAQLDLLQLEGGVLYLQSPTDTSPTKQRIVLPQSLVRPALTAVHDGPAGAHLGRMKTLKKMSARFWKPGLTKDVHRYCDGCLTCAKCKSRPKPRAPLQPLATGNPMQRIHIDIVGPLPRTRRGNRYILTVQCSFTKWAEAFAIPNQRATTCAKVLVRNWICRFGVPDSIHSDQGRNFESKVFEEMCHLLEINKTRSTAYHPEGNGQIENLHKTLKSMLKAKVEGKPQSWDEHLDYCMMAYRSSIHASTGHTPFELMFGREMRIPLDVMMGGVKDSECSYTEFAANLQEDLEGAYRDVRENLKVAQRRQKDAYDKGVKHTVYQPGDLVLRYTPQLRPGEASKFHRQWDGPFEIVSQVTEVTYCVRKVAGRSRRSKVVHFNNLRLYQRKQEKAVGEVVTGGLGTAPAVETVEEGHARSMPGEEDGTVVGVAMSAVEEESELLEGDPELSSQQPDMPEISGCQSEDVQPSGAERDVRSDPSVEAPDTKDGGPLVDPLDAASKPTQPDPPDLSGEEEGSEHEGEGLEPEPTLQNRRHVRVRRPPDRYGEWVISSLQQIVDRVQMLEDRQTMEKDRIRKLRPKLLKKARALRGY